MQGRCVLSRCAFYRRRVALKVACRLLQLSLQADAIAGSWPDAIAHS